LSRGEHEGWIGVDLDGTLAHYDGWKGPEHIGEPVPLMLARVKIWLSEGRDVRLFTARATQAGQIPPIQRWCMRHLGQVIGITYKKDFEMEVLWDDRCVQVVKNTGERVG
jgi:hypothetical protein